MQKKSRTRWTSQAEARLIDLACVGITKSEAARRLGYHHSVISIRSRVLGLEWVQPPRSEPSLLAAGPRWTVADDETLIRLLAEGWPIGLAANEMDRAYNTVLHHSKLLKLKWVRGGRRSS